MLSELYIRIRSLFRRATVEEELDDELRFHLESQAEKYVQAGMTAEQARRRARLEFGTLAKVEQECREARGVTFAERLAQNTRFGFRVLRNDARFAAVAVLPLALGIGATTAIFTAAYVTLLAPLPYPHSDRLVNVWSSYQGHRTWVSVGDFTEWKRHSTAFEDLNAESTSDFNIATQDRPEFIEGIQATPGYYKMLGNPLFLGRDFLNEEDEPGKDHVVILTHRLWRRLGANPRIIGRMMQVDGKPYTVVGVFAPGVADRWDWELIVPLAFEPEEQSDHDSRYLLVTGRLKPGITIEKAQAQLEALAATEAKDYPKSNQGWHALAEPFRNDFLTRDRKSTLLLLLGAVGFLLLIACLNLANLLLAKGITRQREVAIRGSLGARPAAIFAQFLVESLVLAFLGGALGVAAGYAMLRGLIATMPPNALPAEADLRLNTPVLLFMLVATTLAGVLFGCVPAWYASRSDPAQALKRGGRSGIGPSHHWLRRILVIAEFALSLPMLAGAGMAIHSLWNLTHVDLGVRTDHILAFYLDSASLMKNPKQINIDSYYRRVLGSIAALPGVFDVGAVTYLPLDNLHTETSFSVEGHPLYTNPGLRLAADLQMVTPGYFRAFGIRILKGRAFTDADDASSPRVAMVNEVFVSRFLNGVDPLRQRLVMEQVIPDKPENGPAVAWQIVGVFHNVKSRASREDNPEIDTSFWQEGSPIAGIGVRAAEDPATMIKTIAAAVNGVDPQAALYEPRTMRQIHDEVLTNDRFMAVLSASFAMVALLLAAVGIYGVTSFSVAQRSHEIALRMALGGTRIRVAALVVKEGVITACVGLSLGVIVACLVGRVTQSIFFGVGAVDLWTLNVVGFVLVLVALLACWIPARRAARVQPMAALRCE